MNTATNAVIFNGPFKKKTRKGKELPFWNVTIAKGRTGEPMIYEVHDFDKAFRLTQNISHDRNLIIINEAKEA